MTLTPELNAAFSVVFFVFVAGLVAAETVGIVRKKKGDTLTEHWQWVDRMLERHAPAGRWAFRVGTAGLLVWALLHFLVGTS